MSARQRTGACRGDRAWSESVWGYAALVMVMEWPSSASICRMWPRRRPWAARCRPWPDLRAVPEAAGIVEVTAGGPARRAPAVAQHGQLADLDAHVPFVRAALLYDGSRQPRPPLAVAVFFLLRSGVADLDRALVGERAVVVLVVHDLAPLPEPSGTTCVVIACTADHGATRIGLELGILLDLAWLRHGGAAGQPGFGHGSPDAGDAIASRYSSRPGCSGQVAASWTRSAIWTRLVRLSLVSSRDTWALTVARLM